jgi:glycosyltransferase involved in cell wall biosynthesis
MERLRRKSSLHILHIIPSLALETGGPSKSVFRICKALADEGNEIALFTTIWPNKVANIEFPLEEFRDGVRVRTFSSAPNFLTSNLPRSKTLLRAIQKCSKDFDLAITHSLWNPLATFAMRELRRNKLPYCLMPHGMLDPLVFRKNRWKKLPWLYLWERKNVEEASLIIFNTKAEENKARQIGWGFEKTFIFPHIIDLQEWKELPPRITFEDQFSQVKGREVILYVGRINWVKNLNKLIEAFAIIHRVRPSAMLVFVGPDSDGNRKKLEKQAHALGVQESLLFAGMLDKRGLKMAYARGDVLALVSQKENFGLVVAEALAAGLPVVLSEGVDLGWNWESRGAMRRVAPDAKPIAEAILDLLERSATLGLPDKEARALAEQTWGNPQYSVQQLLETFQKIKN